VRLVAADDAQGAANAILAKRFGLHSLFLLADGSPYGRGLTAAVATTAKQLGIHILGIAQWPQGGDFARLARTVARARPDGVFLAGTVDEGGDALIAALRNALGHRPRILLSDGFTPFPVLLETGPAAEGATVTVAVSPLSRLPRAGKAFVASFGHAIGGTPEPYAAAAGAAAETILAAIARSDGTRTSVRTELLHGASDGILGSFRFDQNGDTTRPIVSVYQVKNGQAVLKTTIVPQASSVTP
jgi:branched-chain amino acid transport system substrate-binding protein